MGHYHGEKMVELIEGPSLDSVPQGADIFSRLTFFVIIKRQELGRNGSAWPLVVVKNGHELPDRRLLSVRMHEMYRTLHKSHGQKFNSFAKRSAYPL